MTSSSIPPASNALSLTSPIMPHDTSQASARSWPSSTSSFQENKQDTDQVDIAPDDVETLNGLLGGYGVQFTLNDDIDRMVVQLVDKSNGEVIRQIPSEEMVNIIQRMKEGSLQLIQTEA
ncbi:flagellar protein FlaG [Larsenimonas suaedae]|uniref:Flagellar protein FlaG n=1 Tax=Larsenimonas suaedae TaxID=1851019 RepID=A0ABU1GT08_9GAMM|nr:flagellar protein FlaG [Larsenimonas suaedae]MCM2971602.1 flagellar protein FlaG [Larsenimonas suaedae]MDR5895154.1 flagellar protein FlaG [Larsenimonas suaedae]